MQPTSINGEGDAFCIDIQPTLLSMREGLSNSSLQPDYYNFLVCSQLRVANEKCYEPEIISIGPYHYHHRQDKLKMAEMIEDIKWHYLRSLLNRNGETVDRYVQVIRELEEDARKCYAELPQLSSQQFIEMMILDGCFIIEIFRKVDNPSLVDDKDPIFKMNWLRNALVRDLMLFENQIPFFVLEKLFQMSNCHHQEEEDNDKNRNKDLAQLAMNFFSPLLPGDGHPATSQVNSSGKLKNLLELIHHNWLPSSFVGNNRDKNWHLIQCASKLVESGVKFKKAPNTWTLLYIKFTNGTMEIPCITIENRTECFLRNLIAYEEYYQDIRDSHIISYVKFLDCLIQSSKDVEILCRHGVIDNWLSDDEAVSDIFNNINHRVTAPTEGFHYYDIFNDVNVYYNKRMNRWMAKLKRIYLNSPWAAISIFAGFALLVLTLIQSTFSILCYK